MRILIIALVAVGFVSCTDTNNPEHAFKTKSLRCNLEHIQYRRGYLKVLTNAYFNENPQKYGEVCAVAMTLDSLASEFNTYADCQLETALPVESQPLHGRWIFRTKLPPPGNPQAFVILGHTLPLRNLNIGFKKDSSAC